MASDVNKYKPWDSTWLEWVGVKFVHLNTNLNLLRCLGNWDSRDLHFLWVNFYISVLIKWLQIFKSPVFLHQPNWLHLCLMTLGASRSWAYQWSLCGFDVGTNVLGGWVSSLLSWECRCPWTCMFGAECQCIYKRTEISENIGEM